MKTHNFEQGSPEWLAIRKGKMTASHAQEIGNNGKGLDTYVLKVMSEFFSSAESEVFTNSDMNRGTELEEQARSMYELETGADVEEVGFIEYDEHVGCSPDGLVGKDGGIEIKCHNDLSHFKMLLNGQDEIDTKYLWQIQMNLLITERKWWDYVAYNPNFSTPLIVIRIKPDPEMFISLQNGFITGKKKMEEIRSKISKL